MHTSPASPNHLKSPLCSTIFNLGLLATISPLIGLTFIARASQFINPPVFPTGGTPGYIEVADVDKNGIRDIVVSNTNGVVSAVLGKGHGTFESPKVIGTFSGGAPPIAVADFNHDGFSDVAVLVGASNSVWVYVGYGNGTFAPPTKTATAAGPAQIAVGDVNGDGRLDIVALTGGGLSTLLGKGYGSFQPAINTAIWLNGNSLLVLGDLNGDGHLDAIVGSELREPVLLLGSGNGYFKQHSTNAYCVPSVTELSLRDINGDGRLDLITTGYEETHGKNDSYMCTALGKGDGTFDGGGMQAIGSQYLNLAFADFNRDGKLDMAAANGDYVGIFFSVGSTLANQTDYRMGPSPWAFAAADFTGNGWTDLAVGTTSGIQIVKNLGHDGFYAPAAIGVPPANWNTIGAFHTTAYVTSLDSTGHPDIAVDVQAPTFYGYDSGYVLTLFGDGTGRFPVSFALDWGTFKGFGIGDFNRDGKLDLFYNQEVSDNVHEFEILLNTGKRSFLREPFEILVENVFGQAPVAGDFNNDGYSDLAIAEGSHIEIYMNHGNGTYSAPTAYSAGDSSTFLLQTDINKDGKRDILAADPTGNQIVVLLGKGNGTFQPARLFPVAAAPTRLVAADFNGDGKTDLAVACGKAIKILLGDGKGNFSSHASYSLKHAVTGLAYAGLRRNGIQDILFADQSSVGIMYGAGNGSFGPATMFNVGSGPAALATGDLNEDGSPDVVVVDAASDAITLLLNLGGTRISIKSSATSVHVGQAVTFTATVAASVPGAPVPTGTVAFKDGPKGIGFVHLSNGKATFTTSTLSPGTHTMTASYWGTSSFNPGISSAISQTITP